MKGICPFHVNAFIAALAYVLAVLVGAARSGLLGSLAIFIAAILCFDYYGNKIEYFRVVVSNQFRMKIESDPSRPCYILTEPWLRYRFHMPSERS
jgi:hypothetical protein